MGARPTSLAPILQHHSPGVLLSRHTLCQCLSCFSWEAKPYSCCSILPRVKGLFGIPRTRMPTIFGLFSPKIFCSPAGQAKCTQCALSWGYSLMGSFAMLGSPETLMYQLARGQAIILLPSLRNLDSEVLRHKHSFLRCWGSDGEPPLVNGF